METFTHAAQQPHQQSLFSTSHKEESETDIDDADVEAKASLGS
jgi:hypothetical protein